MQRNSFERISPSTLILCPTLRPPKPKSFQQISDYEKIKLHLYLHRSDALSDEYAKSSSIGILDSNTSFLSCRMNPTADNKGSHRNETNIISLFDGDITVPLCDESSAIVTQGTSTKLRQLDVRTTRTVDADLEMV